MTRYLEFVNQRSVGGLKSTVTMVLSGETCSQDPETEGGSISPGIRPK